MAKVAVVQVQRRCSRWTIWCSGGESERLQLATRLALADLLARDERQLVALDELLTATEADRLGCVVAVLEDAAELGENTREPSGPGERQPTVTCPAAG